MQNSDGIAICWLRRDLRLEDNAALFHALQSGLPVQLLFIFDRNILDDLEDKSDKRVLFIYRSLEEIQRKLSTLNSRILVRYGDPEQVLYSLLELMPIKAVYANHDYEPYAIKRDTAIAELLKKNGIVLKTCKDQVIFEKDELMKEDGSPYSVFTPYSKKWKAKLSDFYLNSYPSEERLDALIKAGEVQLEKIPMPSLEWMGFKESDFEFPPAEVEKELLLHYAAQRDYPALEGTSRLGVHLRFGTISIRKLVRYTMPFSESYLNELIWREFYQMICWNFPRVGQGLAFRPAYDFIPWRNREDEFVAWCEGRTGYPIVDAGMRELNATGYMHNRVRMIVASFLTKHLLIDWRWGEAYFAKKLLDYDFASNNGGWQWAAGSGCDAAPYFRVFNPSLQAKKFDPRGLYIRRWVPELDSFDYPAPIVEHEWARKRCLEVYGATLRP